jgi:Predicted esterase of the alpha-beta hydrolase superfamily
MIPNIALAFSGGGFRAAAFSLGTLSYLQRLNLGGTPLTRNISYIVSTSGGTITNLLYTAAMHRGDSFDTFYDDLKSKLNGEDLLEYVLSVLNDDNAWDNSNNGKRRNLINAFAKAYDEKWFNGETMEVYSNKEHVRNFEVCCNATEFFRGLTFRFQTNGTRSYSQLIGNYYMKFDVTRLATFQKIKLADVLAASSCFPLGLEPMMFPEDFTYKDQGGGGLTAQELREAFLYRDYEEAERRLSDPSVLRSFGLMDGGITDNQGLKSLMLADERRRRKRKPDPFDLMIVTDVSSYFMDYYEVPEPKEAEGWRGKNIDHYVKVFQNVARYPRLFQYLALLIALGSIITGIVSANPYVRFPALIVGGISSMIFMLIWIIRRWPVTRELLKQPEKFDPLATLRRALPLESFSDHIISKILDYLRFTKLNVLEQMLKARISSVMSMVLDVNLKQVRRLIYEMFYTDPCWDDRRVPNFIYELSRYNQASRNNRFRDPKRLGWTSTEDDRLLLTGNLDNLAEMAEQARLMGTTLWFDRKHSGEDQLANIIKTGQFTTCMNLLEYVISLERKKVALNEEYRKGLKQLKEQLVADINRFKNDPGFLFR